MFKNSVLKGVFFVTLGATSFGVLATFVKMAYNEGYTTATDFADYLVKEKKL